MNKRQVAERDSIVAEFLAMIPGAVRAHLRRYPHQIHLQEDMEQSSMERIVYMANRHLSGHPIKKNMKGYARLCIRSGIWEAVRTNDVIQSPRNCPAQQSLEKDVSQFYGATSDTATASGRLLDACCMDDVDHSILKLLFDGRSHSQICEALKITEKVFKQRRRAISERVERLR